MARVDDDRRGVIVGAPGRGVGARDVEHQVRVPVSGAIPEVLILRHHVGHGAGLGRDQDLVGNVLLDLRMHLRGGHAGEHEARALDPVRQHRADGLRVVADGSADLGIPEIDLVERRGPAPLDHTGESVRSLRRDLVAARRQDQDRRVGGEGGRGRAARQGDFGVGGHHVLLERRLERRGDRLGVGGRRRACGPRRDEHNQRHGTEGRRPRHCLLPVSPSRAGWAQARLYSSPY